MVVGDVVKEYLDYLEKLLVQFEVPTGEWRQIMSAKITSEAQQFVLEYLSDAKSTFQDIRDALLQCVGLTATKVTSLLFDHQSPSVDTVIPIVALNKVDKWISTLCKGEKVKNRIVIANVTSTLELGLREFLTTKRVMTRQEMGALIGEWHSIHCSQPVPANSKPTATGNEGTKKVSHLPTTCYNCGKMGHRAVDF